MPNVWTRAEVESTIASYMEMLLLELQGQSFNKSEYRRQLARLLNGRSEAAVERKHRNISAILIESGKPFIDGYKPLFNYQKLLQKIVLDHWAASSVLKALAARVVSSAVSVPEVSDILSALESAPKRAAVRKTRQRNTKPNVVSGVDYLGREARNRNLGRAGELFVMRFEQARLIHEGEESLADKVIHVSEEEGDGAGFDIRSFETDGTDRLIEVKTTSFGKQTPFYLTSNELRVSTERENAYHLYRLFKFRTTPRLFTLTGRLDAVCELSPVNYLATVK